eukprot:103266_1
MALPIILTAISLLAAPINCQYFITAHDSYCLSIGTNVITNSSQLFWCNISHSSNCINWAFEKHFNRQIQGIYHGKLFVNGIGANAIMQETYLNERMHVDDTAFSFIKSESELPTPQQCQSVGYDSTNNIIELVGGYPDGYLHVEYSIDSDTFTNLGSQFDEYQRSFGQSYTQIGNVLYTGYGNKFDVVTELTTNLPMNGFRYGCFTTINDYIFWVGHISQKTKTFVYNVVTGTVYGAPSLQEAHSYGTCEIVNNYLYVIAGDFAESIEKLYVDINDINGYLFQSRSWDASGSARSVVVGSNIFIFLSGTPSIHVLDTVTDTISIIGELSASVSAPGVPHNAKKMPGSILVHNIWYLFGVDTNTSTNIHKDMMYYDFSVDADVNLSEKMKANGIDEFEFDLNKNTLKNKKYGSNSINCTLGMSQNESSFLLDHDTTTVSGYPARFDCSNSGSVASAAINIAYQGELFYVFQKKLLSFDDSDASCRFNYGEHLASIHNRHENEEAIAKTSLYQAETPSWFGLNDIETEGTWTNIDTTPLDYGLTLGSSPWHTAQPDGGDATNCATIATYCDLYEITGPIEFADNNCQGTVSIPDTFRMSFDFTIDTWSDTHNGYIHLFDINVGETGEIAFRYGQRNESPYNGSYVLYFKFALSGNPVVLDSFSIDRSGDDDGKTFHLEAFNTQTTVMISIDGTVVSDTTKLPHEILTDAPICFANERTKAGRIADFRIYRDCKGNPLIESLRDHAFTATSYYDDGLCLPYNARRESGTRAWCALTNNDPDDYLQVDLGKEYLVDSVSVYPRFNAQFVTTYTLSYSNDEQTFEDYPQTLNGPQQYTGDDAVDEANSVLDSPIVARYLRWTPLTVFGYKSLRVEAYAVVDGPKWNDQLCQFQHYSLCNHPHPTVIINEKYSRSLSVDNLLGFIDVLDEIYVEFDIVIHSFPPDNWYYNILQIGNTAQYERFPSIFSHTSGILSFKFTNVVDYEHAVSLHTQYHFTLYQTQNHITITKNNEKLFDEATPSHSIVFNKHIYMTSPWRNSTNATVSNLFISTSNSHSPNAFNYLCDADNRFSITKGAWIFNTNDCTLQSNNDIDWWNAVWLGDEDPSSMNWTDITLEVTFSLQTGAGDITLLFRTQSAASLDDRDGYFLALSEWYPQSTAFGFFTGTTKTYFTQSTTWQWEFNVTYSVRIEILGSYFAFYRNDEFLFSSSDSNMTFVSGTIGLNTQKTIATFHSVRIVFQSANTQSCAYLKLNSAFSIENAEQACLDEHGTSLASIHSLRDYERVQTLCNTGPDVCWIGGISTANCTWEWNDGTEWNYTPNWAQDNGCNYPHQPYMCLLSNIDGLHHCHGNDVFFVPICNALCDEKPSSPPTTAPTNAPSSAPTDATMDPTAPSMSPTHAPSTAPTSPPSMAPSFAPSVSPTSPPSMSPTHVPSTAPTAPPSVSPTFSPSNDPSDAPSISPTPKPTMPPTNVPTQPSRAPTTDPTASPTRAPTSAPSASPSQPPTVSPSDSPSSPPSVAPSSVPTLPPTTSPTNAPSLVPTFAPSRAPSLAPSDAPSLPSYAPSRSPTAAPSLAPSHAPTNTCNDAKYGGTMSYSNRNDQDDVLRGAESLVSVNCRFLLTMEKNGNLIMYGSSNQTDDEWVIGWSTHTQIKDYSGESVPEMIFRNGRIQVLEYMYESAPSFIPEVLWNSSKAIPNIDELTLTLTDTACLILNGNTVLWKVCATFDAGTTNVSNISDLSTTLMASTTDFAERLITSTRSLWEDKNMMRKNNENIWFILTMIMLSIVVGIAVMFIIKKYCANCDCDCCPVWNTMPPPMDYESSVNLTESRERYQMTTDYLNQWMYDTARDGVGENGEEDEML